MLKPTFIALIIYISCTLSTFAQLYNFTNYSLEHGLPQSTVFCSILDSRGYLWVGTEAGAARFNGKSFEVYDRSNHLPGNTVRSIIEDTKGNLWFGTDNGIAIYNGNSWQTINSKQGLEGSSVTKLLPDNNGNIWAATNDAGVNIISFINDSIVIENISSQHGLCSDFILDIISDTDSNIWLASIGGLSSVTYVNNKFEIKNIGDSLNLPSLYISCIEKDKDGNLWLGTLDKGAFLWKKNTTNFISYNSLGITDLRIWDIYCHSNGSVWFATEKEGIFVLKNNCVQNITSQNGLPGNQIFSIYNDKNQNIWLGSVGKGLVLFNGFRFIHYSVNDGLPGSSVFAVKADSANNIYIATENNGLVKASISDYKLNIQQFNSTHGFRKSDVNAINFNSKGQLIAGTSEHGLAIFENNRFRYIDKSVGLLNNTINCVYSTLTGNIYVGSNLGFNEISANKIKTISEEHGLINPEVQTIITDNEQNVWIGTLGGLATFNHRKSLYRDFNEQEGLFDLSVHTLAVDKYNKVWIGTNNGIYYYNHETDTIIQLQCDKLNSKTINSLLFYNDSILIASTNKGFNKIQLINNNTLVLKVYTYNNTNGFIWSETNYNSVCTDKNNNIWFGTVNGLTCYKPAYENQIIAIPDVHIKNIRLSFENVNWAAKGFNNGDWTSYPEKLELPYYENHITFDYEGIFLKNPDNVVYRYKLEPDEKDWSPVSNNTSVTYSGLGNGKYTFSVIASSDNENWSAPITYLIVIRPPFWKTIWFLTLVVLLIAIIIIIYIRYRENKLIKEKQHLEKVVKERTAEVVAQKEEIEHQKNEITGSITYAQRIQHAILPAFTNLQNYTNDCFILYKPRDIVSGDYYWIERIDNKLIVAAADCTGHGVPGAFMSMLGISFMNKIVMEQHIYSPNIILNNMRSNIIESLKQGDYSGSTKDGMDMAIATIDLNTLVMEFAGAYNSAVLISNNEASEIKADRMPVGYHIVMDSFTSTNIQLHKGDCVYMYSDGFHDQIGGPDGRKFMKKNMRQLLLQIHSKPFVEQHTILDTTIEEWKNHPDGKTGQMDDILIVGFRI